MTKRIAIAFAILCASFGAACAQDKPEIYPQLGHSGNVSFVALSPDGKIFASASDDKTVKLWDAASAREIRTLNGHSGSIQSVAFTPDGRCLASAGWDRFVRLWDVATGREVRVFDLNTTLVEAVAFSPDGRMLASADLENIRLWDVTTGRELRALKGHKQMILYLAYSPDGRTLASASDDKTIKLWDTESGRELRTLLGHTDAVQSIAFSADGKTLASGSSDKTVKIWSVASGRELSSLNGKAGGVESVAFSPDGRTLAARYDENVIKLWNPARKQLLQTIAGASNLGFSANVVFSPDGRTLASGNGFSEIELWDISTGHPLRSFGGHTSEIRSVAFSPDGATLVAGGWSKLHFWIAKDGQKLQSVATSDSADSIVFSSDGRQLATSDWTQHILQIWQLPEIQNLATWDEKRIAVSADGHTGASLDNDRRTIHLWHGSSSNVLATLDGPDNVDNFAFSLNGKVFAAAATDTIKIWDVASGREMHTLKQSNAWALEINFSHDGKTLASGEQDNISLWDTISGHLLHEIHVDRPTLIDTQSTQFAFSPDDKMLASNDDHSVRLWDVSSGKLVRVLDGHVDEVTSIDFSADGKFLVSGSRDGTVRLWDLATGTERVSLITFNDGSSIAVTPEGYFDSSGKPAEDNLNVRIGNRVFGISSFRDHFYRPDLVKAAIAGEDISKYGRIGDVKLSPVVELANLPAMAMNGDLTFGVHLTNGGGGFGPVRVFVNGVAIQQDSTLPDSGDALTRSYTVPLLPGQNDLRAVAFNADGSMWSDNAASVTADLPVPAKSATAHGTLHAVVIGIQTFPQAPNNNLKYPSADAQLFVDTLRKYAAPLFNSLDILPLTSPAETDKAHIVDALKAMQEKAAPGDEFVLYVAGHGEVFDGEYYLITSNATAPNRFKADTIGSEELAGLLANIKATKKLVVLDTCHAGAALSQSLTDRGVNTNTKATVLGRDLGVTVLAAATSDQEAIEDSNIKHGMFTYVLVSGLSGKALDPRRASTGIVDTILIADYLVETVPTETQTLYGHAQQPITEPGPSPFPITQVR